MKSDVQTADRTLEPSVTSPGAADGAPTGERPPYAIATLVGLVILGIYVVTIAPTTQFWDTSEYIAAAKVLGIPHPPGNPLFVILAHVWGMIPLAAGYALRINLFAAMTSALASGLLFLVAERFLRAIIPEPRWARWAAAAAGTLVGATSFTVWNQSVVNEKVYTLSLLFIALVLWLTVRWGDTPAGGRRDARLLMIGYLLALSSTGHMMGALAGAAVAAYVLLTDWREALRPWVVVFGILLAMGVFGWWAPILNGPTPERVVVIAVLGAALAYAVFRDPSELRRPQLYLAIGVVLIGVSLNYAFLPIRAAHFPPINEGEPTTWKALWDVLSREQYQKPPLIPRQADLVWQYANYVQYFTWQFAHDWGARLRAASAVLFAGIGFFGAAAQWKRDRRAAWAMIALMATVTVLLVYYLNFKYGFSIRPGENLEREVRERDYFFIASFQLWGLWVALGLGAAAAAIAAAMRERESRPTMQWALATPVLLLAVVPLLGNRLTASRAGETFPRDMAWDLLQSVEPYGILVTAGDNDTFPLWYMQEVEGVRKDVIIANTSLMNTFWHNRQIKRRPVFPFDSANAIAPYRGQSWPAPTTPAISQSYAALDAIPPVYELQGRSMFRLGNIRAVINKPYLERADVMTLQLIQDNFGKRPFYFSRTVGPYADQMGFGPYLLGQGLVRKLMPDSVKAGPGVVALPSLGWVDVSRTRTLLFDEYHTDSAARNRPRGWVDVPSEGMMTLYALLYATFGDYLAATASHGDSATAAADSALGARGTDLAQRIFSETSLARNQPALSAPRRP